MLANNMNNNKKKSKIKSSSSKLKCRILNQNKMIKINKRLKKKRSLIYSKTKIMQIIKINLSKINPKKLKSALIFSLYIQNNKNHNRVRRKKKKV